MLLLLCFGLVLVATILLVLGLLSDGGLLLIWLSMASSVAAALVLLIALRLNKPKAEELSTGPAPLPEPLPEAEPEPAKAGAVAAGAGATTGTSAERDEWLATDQGWSAESDWDEADEVEFPIADYDDLTVGQILPLLPQLYPDEIPVVEERERLTKARPQILDELAALAATARAGTTRAEPLPEPAEVPSGGSDDSASGADPLASYTEPVTAGAWDDDEWFPIEDYESLSAAQIRPLLAELDEDELEMVRAKESSLGRRRSLLDEIDRLRGGAPEAAPAAAGPSAAAARSTTTRTSSKATTKAGAAKKATSKKATAEKATAKKATAKKAPAKKSPAKKATAKKATAKKATAKKTPSKTAPAKKSAPAKKTAAKKAPAKKAPAKKAPAKKTPAKKATAKKATPAKKTSSKRTQKR